MNENIRKIFETTGFEEMSEVQKAAIPAIMDGNSLFIQAKTGAGKTYAYLIPSVANVYPQSPDTQILIIAPTRELAVQVNESAERICPFFNVHSFFLIRCQLIWEFVHEFLHFISGWREGITDMLGACGI